MIRSSSIVAVVLAVVLATAGVAHSAVQVTTSTGTLTSTSGSGLPLYKFVRTGSGPLPWSATSLSATLGGATMSAGPRSAQRAGVTAVAFATSTHAVGLLVNATGSTTYRNLTDLLGLDAAADAPVPFFDVLGRLNLVYVTAAHHLVMLTNDPVTGIDFLPGPVRLTHQDWLVHDLTAQSVGATWPAGVLATGQPTVSRSSSATLIAVRTSAGAIAQLTVAAQRPFAVSDASLVSAVTPATTFAGNPEYLGPLADGVVTIAAVDTSGNLDVFRRATVGSWSLTNLTTGLKSPAVTNALASTVNGVTIYLGAITRSTGSLEVFLAGTSGSTLKWTSVNATAATATNTTPGPALSGTIAATSAGTVVSFAGQAAGWGDLFTYANSGPQATWVVTDVSATGGSNAKTVGAQVAAAGSGTSVTFFAGGVATPAPRGVGIYDIPSAALSHVISDGWPIVAVTGGLGTVGSPWVQTAVSGVASTPDFQLGMTVQNSHRRATWLSFWTVSGPSGSEFVSPATFRAHGVASGAAIARTIDQYRNYGLGLKPDWVIFDPEGYPDNHSQLDGIDVASIVSHGTSLTVTTSQPTSLTTGTKVSLVQTGFSKLNVTSAALTVVSPTVFTLPASAPTGLKSTSGKVVSPALFANNWSAMLAGWSQGITSVDPSLKPAVYVDESEYLAAGIANQQMPVFMAIAYQTSASAHTFTVVAHNVVGSSSGGSVTSYTSGVPGRPLNVAVRLNSNTSATVSWSPPASNGGSPITGYTVSASPGGATCTTTSTSCTITGLSNLIGNLTSPFPITHSSNVLGYIEWGNLCQPGIVKAQLSMLTSPPWSGLYNTVQFVPGVNGGYCTPSTP